MSYKEENMLNRGDVIKILPQYQDAGDDEFTWMVINDEEKGKVDISPVSIEMNIKPIYSLRTDQVVLIRRRQECKVDDEIRKRAAIPPLKVQA